MAGPMLSDRARSFPTRQKDMNYDGGTARRCLRWRGTGIVSECHIGQLVETEFSYSVKGFPVKEGFLLIM